MAAYRREEAILNQEAADVANQIRTFEAQLRALKSKQAEIEDRRAQLQSQARAISDGAGSFLPRVSDLSPALAHAALTGRAHFSYIEITFLWCCSCRADLFTASWPSVLDLV
jgi:chromosome segregation ATPase